MPEGHRKSASPGNQGAAPALGNVIPFVRTYASQEAYVEATERLNSARSPVVPEMATQPRASSAPRPDFFYQLDAAIDTSAKILALQDDWDGAGAQGYRHGTWARAVRFLRTNASEAASRLVALAIPRILEGPSGSIDLHWRLDDFELLVNVPEDVSKPIRFFGDDQQGTEVKGTIGDTGPNAFRLLPWLTE